MPMTAAIAFLVVLSVLILIHEAGHYFVARIFKVKAEEFGYGLPPRAIGFVKDGKKWKRVKGGDKKEYSRTIWSLNWLPIGGFVRLKGEQGDGPDGSDSFQNKPVWQRFCIIAAGVVMNWVLAAVLLSIGLMIGVPAMLDDMPKGAVVSKHEVTIIETVKDGAADRAGIEAMDVLVRVADAMPASVSEAREMIGSHAEPFDVTVRRGDKESVIRLEPVYLKELDRPGIGVALVDTGTVRYPIHLAIVNGVRLTGAYTKSVVLTFGNLFADLFRGGGETSNAVSGPVGIAVMAGQVAERGMLQLMQFAAILSINLAVLNFLPIPALDGGRAVFLILEAIRRKPVKRNVEAVIHNVAFLVLIALIILISVRDVWRMF